MTTAPAKKARPMPKGGRKGGTSFPRVSLADAVGYAKKLVAKTHTGAQPQDVIFAGVVGAKSGKGQVRIGALKQYGLMKGDAKANYTAEELAKQINAAPHEELQPLLRQAALRPAVFKKIFDAFHGDTVTKAKLRQRAIDLHVHPEEADTCVSLYVAGMTTSGLVSIDADKVTHVASSELSAAAAADDLSVDGELEVAGDDERAEGEVSNASSHRDAPSVSEGSEAESIQKRDATTAAGPRAVFNVNVTLDSSLDIEKLQKQLELLKRFGAI